MTLTDDSARRITLLYYAAKRNGSLVTVRELPRLLREWTTETEIEEAIASVPLLSSKFVLRSGYVVERDHLSQVDPTLSESGNRRIARTNLWHVSRFASILHSCGFDLVAASGSTSYGSAALSRDADLFCVSPSGSMWISLTKGLILARAYDIVTGGGPGFCLSCIMDETFARMTFETQRHPLFARDALEAKVLEGQNLYEFLMKNAGWISDYYPVAYKGVISDTKWESKEGPSALSRALNTLLFRTVGRYVNWKSSILNRRLRTKGRVGDAFHVRCGDDHLIYESRRYVNLRLEYEDAERQASYPHTNVVTS
jgi:hypothetical protein